MKTYACSDFYHPPNSYPVCTNWVELEQQQHSFLAELSNLSYQQTGLILSMTALLFATAWVWRLISKQALR